ncbi:hypothetical protein GCM10028801_31170 [Nocardioides maradonensis]
MAELHAHIDTRSTDCDGTIDRRYVAEMTDRERANDLAELQFRNRVLADIVNTQPWINGQLKIGTYDSSRSPQHATRMEWFEETEEGSIWREATFCTEDDCDMTYSQRDHSAEAAGY